MALIFQDASSDLLTIFVIASTCVYLYFKYTFSYWKRRGIKNIPASIPFGNFGPTFLQKMHVSELSLEQKTPTYTSGKLKGMFSTLNDCGAQKYLAKAAAKRETVKFRENVARYTTTVIASVAFGIDINCIDNPDTSFRKYGRKFFELNIKNGLCYAAMLVFSAVIGFVICQNLP